MAKNDDIIDLDKLPEQDPKSFGNFFNRFLESFPKVPEPPIDLAKIKLKTQPDDGLSYNKDRGILKIEGESVKFTVDRKMANVLKTIFSEELSKEWSWDEIVENWEEDKNDYQTPGGAQVMIYNTGKNIIKRVAAETGNKNFLIVTYKKIKVNPKYLK